MKTHLLAVAAFCLAAVGWAYEPPAHTNSFTRAGVTYAKRGGLGNASYVVTNVAQTSAPQILPRYLHFIQLDSTYPEDAKWYYDQMGGGTAFGCSAVRRGATVYRNYDWTFDWSPEWVVAMSAGEGRFASLGVASVGDKLTEDMVESGARSRYFKCLAGATLDGINENGVMAEINVNDGPIAGWNVNGDIHVLGAVRWALDNGTNAAQAAEHLAAHVRRPSGLNFHYLVADRARTFIVENGAAHEVMNGVPVLTNFQLYPKVRGGGWERQQLLTNGHGITNCWFTRAYSRATNPAWMSDFGDSTAKYQAALDAWNDGRGKEAHRGEKVNGESWWQTVHTSVYDLNALTLAVAVQEADDWYAFAVPAVGKVKSVNGRTGEVELDAEAVGAYSKAEADSKYLTTNLVGKTLVSGSNTVFSMGAGTRIYGTDDAYILLGGGNLRIPTNMNIAVSGGRTLDTYGITNALVDNADLLASNGNFKAAVERVSPPVELPEKWALANVTNAQGQAVNAADVGALPSSTTHLSGDVPTSRKVNNKPLTSDITLNYNDVGAMSAGYVAPVNSVNGKQMNVVLNAADVHALPDNTAFVSSVNGKTGTVNLNAGDVDAYTKLEVYGMVTYLRQVDDLDTYEITYGSWNCNPSSHPAYGRYSVRYMMHYWVLFDADGYVMHRVEGHEYDYDITFDWNDPQYGHLTVHATRGRTISKDGDSIARVSQLEGLMPQDYATVSNRAMHAVRQMDGDINILGGAGSTRDANRSGQVSIGYIAKTGANGAIAIGQNTFATNSASIALGIGAHSHGARTFNVPHDIGNWYAGDTPVVTALQYHFVEGEVDPETGARTLVPDLTDPVIYKHDCTPVNPVAEFYDAQRDMTWRLDAVDFELKLYAATNVDATAFCQVNNVLTDTVTTNATRLVVTDGELKFFHQ